MKKSVKSLLLALMVLCLSATAVFAATSADVLISVDVNVSDVTVSPDTIHFTSEDGKTDKKPTATVEVKNTSKDISKIELIFDIKSVAASVDDAATAFKPVSVDAFTASADTSKTHKDTAGSIVSASVEIIVSEDDTFTIPFAMNLSRDNKHAIFNFSLTVKVSADFTEAGPTGGAFDSVTITATDSSKDTFTVSVVSTDVSFALASADYATVSKDLKDKSSSYTAAAGSISFALSGTSSASIKAVYSLSGDVATEITASSGAYASTISEDVTTTFVFVFASGDKFGGVKFDVKGSSSSSEETEKTIEDIATDAEVAAAATKAFDDLGWTEEQMTEYATALATNISGATITSVTSTDTGIAILNISDGTNLYAGIPAVNGKIVVAVDSSGNVTGLPSYVTPDILAAEFATLTGQSSITSVATFYSNVFPTDFFTDNTPAAAPEDTVEDDETGGVTSFTGTLANELPYGTIILVLLQPTDEATTASDVQAVMVHAGALKGMSAKIAFALANLQNIGGSSLSSVTLPVTEPYNIGYSTPDGGNTFSNKSVEDGSVGIAAVETEGDSGSLASELTLNGATKEEVEGSNKGSSSGCDAGFGALALLAIVPFIRKIRK